MKKLICILVLILALACALVACEAEPPRSVTKSEIVNGELVITYSDGTTERGRALRKSICDKFGFASLEFQSLEGVIKSIGLPPEKLCTYCWNGKE